MDDRDDQQAETGLSDEARHDRQKAEQEVAARYQRAHEADPHHDLNNPVKDPDPTEYPDPYEKRPDPRAPDAADAADDGGEGEAASSDPSTSDPPPPRNIDRAREGEGEG